MTLNLHHLRLFRAVAHDGTLTGAAQSLNISQSAVSTQVRALEASLGHALFDREGRRLSLTEAGRIALDHAEEIFRASEALTATLKAKGAGQKILHVGALATLSRNFQMAFLEPMIGRSDVELVLRSGPQDSLLANLDDLSLDVVLTNQIPAREAGSAILVHRIDEQPVSIVGACHRAAPDAKVVDLLASQPLVLPARESSLRAGFDALLDRLGIVPHIAAEADDMAMLRLLARADAGLAVIPPIVVKDELATGRLHDFGRIEGISEIFCAVTISRRFPNPLLAELLPPAEAQAKDDGSDDNPEC